MSKEVKRSCAICQTDVLWYPFKIKQHLAQAHGITLEKYFYLHVKKPISADEDHTTIEQAESDLSKPSSSAYSFEWDRKGHECLFCGHKLLSYKGITMHLAAKHEIKQNYRPHFKYEGLRHQCLMCSESVEMSRESMIAHLRVQHGLSLDEYEITHRETLVRSFQNLLPTTAPRATRPTANSKWDRCLRHCHVCGEAFTNLKRRYFHLRDKHQVSSLSAPQSVEGDLERHHTCLVCSSVIKFQGYAIAKHLKIHNMTLDEYEEQYSSVLELIFESLQAEDQERLATKNGHIQADGTVPIATTSTITEEEFQAAGTADTFHEEQEEFGEELKVYEEPGASVQDILKNDAFMGSDFVDLEAPEPVNTLDHHDESARTEEEFKIEFDN